MRPIVRASLVVAGLAALAQLAAWLRPAREQPPDAHATPATPSATALCPPGTLPDARACIPVPPDVPQLDGAPGSGAFGEALPRRADRPEPAARYAWPIELSAEGAVPAAPSVAPLALVLPQRRGLEVRSIALEHQVGNAELVAIADLVGTTAVTQHTLRHPSGLRQYLVFYGRLGSTDPSAKPGASLAPGSVVGQVGDSGAPGDVHLFLEVRQIRRGVDLATLPVEELRHPARTIPCDPRNVFPLR